MSAVALDELLSVGSERGDRLSLVDTLEDKGAEDPVAVFESQELKHILAGAINRLGEREKIVITLYYYEGLALAEIGQVLGVTSHASARCTPRRCSSSEPRGRTPARGGCHPSRAPLEPGLGWSGAPLAPDRYLAGIRPGDDGRGGRLSTFLRNGAHRPTPPGSVTDNPTQTVRLEGDRCRRHTASRRPSPPRDAGRLPSW